MEFEDERLTEPELREVEQSVVREVIADQVKAGIDLPTDGELTWYDSQSHFSRHLDGVEVTGLVRYFDTNTYYRQPDVRGPIRWSSRMRGSRSRSCGRSNSPSCGR